MYNNQEINVDWRLCFIYQQQANNKLRSTPLGIKSLSLRVLDITCSCVISSLPNEAELENHISEKETKYHKVCITGYVGLVLSYLQRKKESS